MSRGAAGRKSARQLGRLLAAGQREVGKVLDALDRVEEASVALSNLGPGRRRSPESVGEPQNRRMRFVGVGLTMVNAAAVVPMLVLPGRTTTAPATVLEITVAVVLAALLAASQIAFAIAFGRGLRELGLGRTISPGQHRRRLQYLPLIDGAALSVLSTLISWAIYLWTWTRVADGQGQLAFMLGVSLALQAWLAPWLLVADTARGRPRDGHWTDPTEMDAYELRTERHTTYPSPGERWPSPVQRCWR